ncbi:MAG: glutamine synthetase type III, partial [Coriobacteriales bacterium]|nr:glutamine synthetase type III [Coriobacteriales bacterium]
QFLVFLAMLVAAVDEHADLMRMSVASAGNDHRLGANEAPPAVVSVFLGDNLSPVVEALIRKEHAEVTGELHMDLGVPQLPKVLRDNTDRNRTSPFAFTGNKFEFRMCGSQQNLSDPNVVLNTAVAEQCERFCDYVAARADEPFSLIAMRFVRHTFRDHQRIIFDGNGYSDEWMEEAARRGLPNLKTTPDAIGALVDPANVELFERYGVLSKAELHARYVAKAEQYEKLIHIEANTMSHMTRHLYLPALMNYSGELATTIATKAGLGIASRAEKDIVEQITAGIDSIYDLTAALEAVAAKADGTTNATVACALCRDEVIPAMDKLRAAVDAMEPLCGEDWWPVPSYNQMLFYV